MSSSAVFDAIAPELASDSRADTFLAMAAQGLSAPAFGVMFTQAAAYLAAHMLSRCPATSGGTVDPSAGGPVASKSAGDLSVSYGSFAASAKLSVGDADLASTAYGQAFLRIRNTRAAARATAVNVSGW